MREQPHETVADTASDLLLQSPFEDEERNSGLWISWDGTKATFRFVQDCNLVNLHPNVYAPAAIDNTKVLKGGGSGATVFAGDLYSEKLVWKHGDHKDVGEVFALAGIEHQLMSRSETAAKELRSRIPKFKGIYISPHHIRIHSQELWAVVQDAILTWSIDRDDSLHNSLRGDSHVDLVAAATPRRRSLTLSTGNSSGVHVKKNSIHISLRQHEIYNNEITCDFYTLAELIGNLRSLQKKYFWKFSIAQSRIGGPHPRTASLLHLSGELRGDTLNSLVDQFITVLRGLQTLAREEEKDVCEMVRNEMEQMDEYATPADVSPLANAFVGFSIHKNFHPSNGRFNLIRECCLALIDRTLILRPEEELPAKVIHDKFVNDRESMAKLFGCNNSDVPGPLHEKQETWLRLVCDAANLQSAAATNRVWTCGLTDAGIHNMFFSNGRLWLFDLGEPGLQPIPAFLTKFLMSFFHTLGMEETTDGTSWVNRFEPSPLGDTVQLTAETRNLLPKAYETFNYVMDRLVDRLFDGEEAVRELLIKYVALQLVSDCAFCLERWQRKGGGSVSYGNHQKGLEKWIWRALWDVHVFADICRQYAPGPP